ncbi:unnamed protein product [Anisakis simplex]|uniref:Transposase n=1 Tax=Anisakis simplex TaxID=6269 RepID=A0A0M3JK07_ANISI|nr:unnamed protein product [Anisakis simplex]
MDAHRWERCVSAPKKTVKVRELVFDRLTELGRDISYIAVPASAGTEATAPNRRRRLSSGESSGDSVDNEAGPSKRYRV